MNDADRSERNTAEAMGVPSGPGKSLPISLDEVTINERVDLFLAAVQQKTIDYTKANYSNLKPDVISAPAPWGKKYIRVTRMDADRDQHGARHGSVHCFINRSNGDILKADGWSSPAKHARGNIFADDLGMSCMDPYGPKYLR